MNPLRVIKMDNQFAVLNRNEEIPAAGAKHYHNTAAAALRTTLDIINDHIDDDGALPAEVEIIVSEHASAELIRSYGFTPIEDHV